MFLLFQGDCTFDIIKHPDCLKGNDWMLKSGQCTYNRCTLKWLTSWNLLFIVEDMPYPILVTPLNVTKTFVPVQWFLSYNNFIEVWLVKFN